MLLLEFVTKLKLVLVLLANALLMSLYQAQLFAEDLFPLVILKNTVLVVERIALLILDFLTVLLVTMEALVPLLALVPLTFVLELTFTALVSVVMESLLLEKTVMMLSQLIAVETVPGCQATLNVDLPMLTILATLLNSVLEPLESVHQLPSAVLYALETALDTENVLLMESVFVMLDGLTTIVLNLPVTFTAAVTTVPLTLAVDGAVEKTVVLKEESLDLLLELALLDLYTNMDLVVAM